MLGALVPSPLPPVLDHGSIDRSRSIVSVCIARVTCDVLGIAFDVWTTSGDHPSRADVRMFALARAKNQCKASGRARRRMSAV